MKHGRGSSPALSLRYRSLRGSCAPSELHTRARALAADILSQGNKLTTRQQTKAFIDRHFPPALEDYVEYLSCQLAAVTTQILPKLPQNYGFKGGAAREVLASLAHQRPLRCPRDVDVIRRGAFHIPGDMEVARIYMPEDFTHGARVEIIKSMSHYMTSRDITWNELAVFENTLFLTPLAALDTMGHTLRPSRYRGGSLHRLPTLDGKILLKLVRLFAEGELWGDPVELVGIPESTSFSDFDLALQLDKAFQRSPETARVFADTLVALGAVNASHDPLDQLLEDLDYLRFGEKALLRHAPRSRA